MANYTDIYCYSHDIDCFFIVNGRMKKFIHFASNGHLIPEFIHREQNERVRCILAGNISQSEDSCRVEIHDRNVRYLIRSSGYRQGEISQKMINNYTSSFVMMAKAGFKSYDMTHNKLFLIAWPSDGSIKKLAQEKGWLASLDGLLPTISEEEFHQMEFNVDTQAKLCK